MAFQGQDGRSMRMGCEGRREQHRPLVGRRCETGARRMGRVAGPLVQKRAADAVTPWQLGDPLAGGEDPERQVLSLGGPERGGRRRRASQKKTGRRQTPGRCWR